MPKKGENKMQMPINLTMDRELIKMLFNAKIKFNLETEEEKEEFTMFTKQFNIIRTWAYSVAKSKYPWFTMTESRLDDDETLITFTSNKVNPQYKKIRMGRNENPYFLTEREQKIQSTYQEFINGTWQDRTLRSENKKTLIGVFECPNEKKHLTSKLKKSKKAVKKGLKIVKIRRY